ncbi:hypothetical protein RSAG8_05817, partial [Rhizoctonia solani AG-8 WAC10335]
MGTRGYFAYRYKRKYYRRYLSCGACPLWDGRRLAGTVPRDPYAFKDWVADRIMTLENAKTCDTRNVVVHPAEGDGADDLGFNVTYDLEWTFTDGYIEWTYVIDLDNLVFTINGTVHLRLDNMPPDLGDYSSLEGDELLIPQEYICAKVDLWPAPNFDTEERQQQYKALQPTIVPATEWGAPTWDELSVSQRFSIEITHSLLRRTSHKFACAYAPFIRCDIGRFCWSVLCASAPALPIFQRDVLGGIGLSSRTLSCGETDGLYTLGAYLRMYSLESGEHSKSLGRDYCWIRGCLVTFCTHLDDPIYVAHEVEQMVQKMRHDEYPESVGIILSSQQELVVVAVDGPKIRHSPVLDIRTTDRGERPGRATDGRLLLTYLLSSPLTVSPLPWRTQPRRPPTVSSRSITGLPPEVLRIIINYLDIQSYIPMCRVSRSIRSVCVANPRVGNYTVLHRIPGFMSVFAARSTNDNGLKIIKCELLQ